MEGKKSTDKWFPVILVDENNYKTPETGKAFGDITVKYSYEAATSATTATITVSDWTEVGEGNYWVQLGNPEFANEGKYQVEVQCTGCYTYRFPVEVTDKTFAEVTDIIDTLNTNIGTPTALDGGSATIASNLVKLADDNDGASYDATTDSQRAIRSAIDVVDGNVDDILVDTNEIQGKLPTNYIMGSSVQTDKDDEIDAILVDTNEIQGKLPTNYIMGSSVQSDKDDEIDSIKSTVDTNLDTTVSSRAAPGDAMDLVADAIKATTYDESTAYPITDADTGATRIARTGADGDTLETLSDQIDGVQTSVDGIQNNTRFVATVPTNMLVPDTGTTMYKITVHFYDSDGNMEDPDNNEIDVLYESVDGTDKDAFFDDAGGITGATAGTIDANMWKMVRISTGVYETYYKLPNTETPEQWTASFKLEEASTLLQYARSTNVVDENPGSITLADNTTNKDIIAEALKERDVSGTGAVSGSIYKDINDNIDANETKIDNVQTDVTSILADTNEIQGKLPTNYIMGSSVQTDKDDEIDAILADTNEMQGKLPTNNIMGSSDKDNHDTDIDAILVDTNEMQGKLPTNNIMGSSDKADYDDNITNIETIVTNVSNNTRFAASYPTQAIIPATGNDVIELAAYFYNFTGDMEDPDSLEIAIVLEDVSGTAKTALYDDYALTTPATVSSTFPGFYKMIRQGQGRYRIYYAVPSTEMPEQWSIKYILNENSTTLRYQYVMGIVDAASVTGSVTLADTGTNRDIIAESLKTQDVSSTAAVTGSVYDDIMDNIDANETKIDNVQTDVTAILADTNEIQVKLPTNNIMGSSDKSDHDDEIAAILVDTNEMQGKLPTNNIMGSSDKDNHDTDIDAILIDTNEMQGKLPTNNIMGSSDKADYNDNITNIETRIGTPVALDGGSATVSSMLTKMADDNGGASFDATTDSQTAIADNIAKIIPIDNLATSQALNSGVIDVGSYTDTHTINSVYFRLSPTGAAVINVDLGFTAAADQSTIKLMIVGRYQVTSPTAGKYVNVFVYNHNTAVFDQLSGTTTRFNHNTVDEARTFFLLPEHVNPSSPYDVTIRFISSDTNVASDLYLDYVNVITVSAAATTPAEAAKAVWDHPLTNLEDQLSAGGILRSSGGLVFTEVIAVTDAKTFRIGANPPGGSGAVWIDHVLVFHDISTGEYQCIPVQSADASGNIVLYRNLSITPVIGDQVAILNETMVKGLSTSAVDSIVDTTWNELRSEHISAGSFGQGVASVQGNVTGNVQGNVVGSIGSLATQAKADVNAEVDQALLDYDAPTKAELDAVEDNIRGADNDNLKTLSDQLDSVQTSIDGISNVTRLSVALPVYMQRPSSGDKPILVEVALKDIDGNMEDPDSNQLALTVYNSSGTNRNTFLYQDVAFTTPLVAGTGTFVGYRQLLRTGTGLYKFYYRLADSHPEEELIFKFGWEESSIALYEYRSSQVTDAASDISQIASDVTGIKGQTDKIRFDGADRVITDAEAISASTTAADQLQANISKLDVNVSTRSSHTAAQAGTDAASKILVTPANKLGTDVSGRIEISGTKNTLDVLEDISVSDILSGNVDGKTVEAVLEVLLSYSQGKIIKSGSNYTYYKQDNATSLFTLTASPTSRTRS